MFDTEKSHKKRNDMKETGEDLEKDLRYLVKK